MRVFFFLSLVIASLTLIAQSQMLDQDSLQANLHKAKDDTSKVDALNTLAYKHYNDDLKKSITYAQQALQLSKSNNYFKGSKIAYNILRRANRRLGNYEAAIRFTLNTLPIAEKLKDTAELYSCYSALGNIYSSLEKYDESKMYLQKSLQYGEQIKSPGLSATYNFIGRNYGKMKKYDSAFYFIRKALDREISNPQKGYTISYIYNNMAEVYLSMGNVMEAEKYYKMSLDLPEDKKSPFGTTYTLNGLAKVYLNQNKTDKAIAVSLQSIEISKKNSYRDRSRETYGLLSEIFAKRNDYEKALHYYKNFNLYQDSIMSEEKIKAIEDLKINYETQEIEHENELLRKSTELKDAELSQRVILGWASILGIGALLIVIFLLYRNNKERTKTNQLLNQYNRDLAEQVFSRTLDLVNSNNELVKQNNQLEQFGYIIAHNLRAPVARILGLTNIIKSPSFSMPADEVIIEKLNFTSKELDTVIHDLNSILDIKKGLNNTLENINLTQRLEKVKSILRDKIKESNTVIQADFTQGD
ncbi:MAG TPA: tetratricopeptide repeat protein, partial [Cyclobacteriaceae bacterium]|nr:tetratricopeptide repeat protein [Cyclobacteriaceae bacterium]